MSSLVHELQEEEEEEEEACPLKISIYNLVWSLSLSGLADNLEMIEIKRSIS
jgi:hypothetical protein